MNGCPTYIPDFEFDYEAFIAAFPFFSDSDKFPEASLQGDWYMAVCWISDRNFGRLRCNSRMQALNLLTAHIAYTSSNAASNKITGVINSASIDKVSVGLTPPPIPNNFRFWLSSSQYGLRLLALLEVKSVGGMVANGSPESAAIRGFNGNYGSYYIW